MNIHNALAKAIEIAGTQKSLADSIGVPHRTLWAWISRGSIPTDHCAGIERATGGRVSRRDLRPDNWHLIWPELVTNEFPAPESSGTDKQAA